MKQVDQTGKLKFIDLTDLHFGYDNKAERKNRKFLDQVNKEVQPECVLVNGDLIMTQQHQIRTACRNLREAFPIIPIIIVFGNHDYWQNQKEWRYTISTWDRMIQKQNEVLKNFNIHHPQRMGPYEIEDVVIFGYDGWYLRADPPNNDDCWLPRYIHDQNPHVYMQQQEKQAIEKILYEEIPLHFDKKKIVLTHFGFGNYFGCNASLNQNTRYMEFFINAEVDVLCYGHTHIRQEAQVRRTKIINPGGGYKYINGDYHLDPEYIQFEL